MMMRRHLPVALYLIVEVFVGTKGFVQAVRMQAVVNRGMAQPSHATCHANLPLPARVAYPMVLVMHTEDTSCNGTLAWEGCRVG